MVVMPALMDLRNVPALSNRGLPPLGISVAAFWAWNKAPARLVMTPLFIRMLPPRFHSTAPPFSSVRVFRETPPGKAAFSITPGGITVRPLPVMLPPVQFIAVLTGTVLVPSNVPLLKLTTAGEIKLVPLKLATPPEMLTVLLVQMVLPVKFAAPPEKVSVLFVPM